MNRIKDADILSVENIFKDKYVIPLYQRNFAWGEEQISRFLQDIYESMNSGDEHFYIGSLIVIQRGNGEFEVIDGQQRLTMLSILSGMLDMGIHLSLRYDSRPEVEDFFRVLYSGMMPKNRKESSVSHFFDAIDVVWQTQLDVENPEPITLQSKNVKVKMVDFIKNKVYIVREIMPSDTDVASYFEIMNNRGEQLQEHEIIKGLLLGKLHEEGNGEYSSICSKIWDSCSQMEIRLQTSFPANCRRILFGNNYDSLKTIGPSDDIDFGEKNKFLLDSLKSQSNDEGALSLDYIIDNRIGTDTPIETSTEEDDNTREESIIDFPNFLMHVFRLYYNQAYRAIFLLKVDATDIPLSEKYLLKVYNAIKREVKPLDFFLRLLHCRLIFDRFVVKSNFTENDEKREWVLQKPYKYTYIKDNKQVSTSLRYDSTFEKSEQDAIVKALSCLQVSFRAKTYKNYLQVILKWFVHDNTMVVAESYLKRLHVLMINEFKRTSSEYVGLTEFNAKRQGTSVHHYLFNFMDYLYWWIKVNNCPIENNLNSEQVTAIKKELDLIKKTDFRFLNRNSVEHHYPQKRQEEHKDEGITDFDLNCLGNLVLISKSANSRLSDKNPKDKAALYSERTDLPPTRQIIYSITRNTGWGKDQITTHLACVESILKHCEQILGNTK